MKNVIAKSTRDFKLNKKIVLNALEIEIDCSRNKLQLK